MTATATSVIRSMDPKQKRREVRRVVLSSYLGSTIEFYDFLLYTTAAALVFPSVFFSDLDPVTGTIASYLTFAAGYVARPLGGVIFGHFGDRLGRKKVLIASMFVMGAASTLIGLVPDATVIGMWGALILLSLRFIQGIAIGGEWGGAALMALEHAEPKDRGFATSFVNAGGPSGTALGTFAMGLAAALTGDQFLVWGWRIPFLASFVLLIIGLIIRTSISESPIFEAAVAKDEKQEKTKQEVPILAILKRPKNLILVMVGGASGFAVQVILVSFAVSYAVEGGVERQNVLYAVALASILAIGFVLMAGRLSDRIGRRPAMLIGMVGFIVLLYPMFWLFGSGNVFFVFLALAIGFLCHGFIYGPFAAFVSEQFGTKARYTGASLGYQMATLLGAGFTPTILAALYGGDGDISRVVIYLAVFTAVSAVAILMTRESKNIDLETYEH